MIIEILKEKFNFANVIESENLEGEYTKFTVRPNVAERGFLNNVALRQILRDEALQLIWRQSSRKLFENAEPVEDYIVEDSGFVEFTNASQIIKRFADKLSEYLEEESEYKFIISNGKITSALADSSDFAFNAPTNRTILNNPGVGYFYGKFHGADVFVDPYMRWDDDRVLIGNEKINLEIDPNIIWEGVDNIEEVPSNTLTHPDIDPFGEENWGDDIGETSSPGKISIKIKYKLDVGNKFKTMKAIDKDGMLF